LSIAFAADLPVNRLPFDLSPVDVFFIPQALAFAIAWTLTALLIRLAPILGLIDRPSDRKVHTQATPRGGGLAIFAAVVLALTWAGQFSDLGRQRELSVQVFGCALVIVVVGLIDDWHSLPWYLRLVAQIAVAFRAVYVSVPNVGWPEIAVAALWVVAMTNAFNMLDNMDALSAGVALIAAGFLAAAFLRVEPPHQVGATIMPYLVLIAALAGFLWFNRPPARIFMGDSGSTFLGFFLGIGSVRLAWPSWPITAERVLSPWGRAVSLAILAVPCYDMASVIFLRLKQGRSPFHADKQHLSHRLVERGLSRRAAVGDIWLLALLSGTAGLVMAYAPTPVIAAVGGGLLAAWWVIFAIIEWSWRRKARMSAISPQQVEGYIKPVPPSYLPPKESSHEPPT
jgi:UDP-GlcNAc:undecaprenyl-phosphate GlcNAc-1-phosphate transferase